jgi:hypothetical protein
MAVVHTNAAPANKRFLMSPSFLRKERVEAGQ